MREPHPEIAENIRTGTHKAVVVLDKTATLPDKRLSFASYDIGPWPFGPEATIRRKVPHDDDGPGCHQF